MNANRNQGRNRAKCSALMTVKYFDLGRIMLPKCFSRFHENRAKLSQFNGFGYRVVVHRGVAWQV